MYGIRRIVIVSTAMKVYWTMSVRLSALKKAGLLSFNSGHFYPRWSGWKHPQDSRTVNSEQNLNPDCPIMHWKMANIIAYPTRNIKYTFVPIKSNKLPSHPQGQSHSQQTLVQVQAQTEWQAETRKRSITINRAWYITEGITTTMSQLARCLLTDINPNKVTSHVNTDNCSCTSCHVPIFLHDEPFLRDVLKICFTFIYSRGYFWQIRIKIFSKQLLVYSCHSSILAIIQQWFLNIKDTQNIFSIKSVTFNTLKCY